MFGQRKISRIASLLQCMTSHTLSRAIHVTPTLCFCDNPERRPGHVKVTSRSPRRRVLSPARRLASMLPDDVTQNPDVAELSKPPEVAYDSDAREAAPPPVRFHGYQGKRRSLSPARRLAAQLPGDFWSVQDDHVKSAVTNTQRSSDDLETNVPHICQDSGVILSEDSGVELCEDATEDERSRQFRIKEGELLISQSPDHKLGRQLSQRLTTLTINGDVDRTGVVQDCRARVPPFILHPPSGKSHLIRRPSLEDYCQEMRKSSFIAHPKVTSNLLFHLSIMPGDRILEAGSGSGSTTLHLSKLVWDEGTIFSLDLSPKSKAKHNYDQWRGNYQLSTGNTWPDNVQFYNISFHKFQPPDNMYMDKIFLDMNGCAGIKTIHKVDSLLRMGGVLGLYSPSVSKIVKFMENLESSRVCLELEGMYEESFVEWRVRTREERMAITQRHESDHTIAYMAYLRKVPEPTYQTEETKPNFLHKLGKLLTRLTNREEPRPSYSERSSTRLQEGPLLLKSYKTRRKKGFYNQILTELNPENNIFSHLGKIQVGDYIGKTDGSTISSSSGKLVSANRSSFSEIIQFYKYKDNTFYRIKSLNQLCTSTDVTRGSSVLEISGNPGPLTAILSNTVGPDGRVDVVCRHDGNKDFFMFLQKHKQIHENYTVHSRNGEADPSLLLSLDHVYDQVCVTSRTPKSYLSNLALKVRPGSRVSILCNSIETVQSVLDEIHARGLQFYVLDVSESNHKPWLLQVSQVQRSDDVTAHHKFIARPKQAVYANTEFIIRLIFGCSNRETIHRNTQST